MHLEGELMATPVIRAVMWRMQNLFVPPHGNSHLGKNNLLLNPTSLNTGFYARLFLQDPPVLKRIKRELILVEVSKKLVSGNWCHCLAELPDQRGLPGVCSPDPLQLGVVSLETHHSSLGSWVNDKFAKYYKYFLVTGCIFSWGLSFFISWSIWLFLSNQGFPCFMNLAFFYKCAPARASCYKPVLLSRELSVICVLCYLTFISTCNGRWKNKSYPWLEMLHCRLALNLNRTCPFYWS